MDIEAKVKSIIAQHFQEDVTKIAREQKFIEDLGADSLQVVELVISALQACGKLSMKHAVVARADTRSLCHSYEETRSWNFVDSLDAALQPMN